VKIKKGDTVKILSGKDRGKISKVMHIYKDTGKVIVEKVNIVKKHKKQTGDKKDEGGIVKVEAPISISKIMVVCPVCDKPTRVKIDRVKGKVKRVCKKCNKSF